MRCACGANNTDHSLYCGKCGQRLDHGADAAGPPAPRSHHSPLLIPLLVVLGFVLFTSYVLTRPPALPVEAPGASPLVPKEASRGDGPTVAPPMGARWFKGGLQLINDYVASDGAIHCILENKSSLPVRRASVEFDVFNEYGGHLGERRIEFDAIPPGRGLELPSEGNGGAAKGFRAVGFRLKRFDATFENGTTLGDLPIAFDPGPNAHLLPRGARYQ